MSGEAPALTEGNPQTQNRGHERTRRRAADFGGVLNKTRGSFQDTAAGTDIINPHKTASRKRDAPLFAQIQHFNSSLKEQSQ